MSALEKWLMAIAMGGLMCVSIYSHLLARDALDYANETLEQIELKLEEHTREHR